MTENKPTYYTHILSPNQRWLVIRALNALRESTQTRMADPHITEAERNWLSGELLAVGQMFNSLVNHIDSKIASKSEEITPRSIMSIEIQKFSRKPFVVEGIQVTEENMGAVAEWCGCKIKKNREGTPFISVHVYNALNDRQTRAFVGDWVLFSETRYKVYTDRAFNRVFEPINRVFEPIKSLDQHVDEAMSIVNNMATVTQIHD